MYSLPVFSVDVELEVAVPELILVVEVARCRIEEVLGVVQVFQIALQEFRIHLDVRS